MTAARKEIPPNEQLWALRHARDRYQALADGLKGDADFEGTPEEKITRELEARRIASAYEKSVANMVAHCRNRHVNLDASTPGSTRPRFAILAFLAAATGIGASFALSHLELPQIRVVFEPAPGRVVPVAGSQTTSNLAPKPSTPVVPQSTSFVPPTPVEAGHAVPRAPRRERSLPAATGPDAGFVAKVLQVDGSLREEFFEGRPAR